MEPKYPSEAYRGFRARLPDWLIGIPYARSLEHAVRLLELKEGDSVCDVACRPGYNLSRLVRAVGQSGLVTAVEDNPTCSRARSRRSSGPAGRTSSSSPSSTPNGSSGDRSVGSSSATTRRSSSSATTCSRQLGRSSSRAGASQRRSALHNSGRANRRSADQARTRRPRPPARLALLDRPPTLAVPQGPLKREHVGRAKAGLRVHPLRRETAVLEGSPLGGSRQFD